MILDWRLPFCGAIFAFINMLTISSGAARMSGVLTKRVATGLTLYNLFVLISRLANLFLLPVIGNIVDLSVKTGTVGALGTQIRIIIGSGTVGSIIGAFLLPTFVVIFVKGISAFETTGSLPKVLFGLLDPRRSSQLLGVLRRPRLESVRRSSLEQLPKGFLIYNVLMMAIWTTGAFSAVYASALVPELARTATLLSGLVNGMATIMFTLVVDPTAAILTDQAVQGIRTVDQIKSMVIFLTVGTVLGTVLAQLLLYPAALFIAFATKILATIGG